MNKSIKQMLHRLQYMTLMAPGTGKTHALCDLAKVIGARVMVHDVSEVLRIEREYGAKGITVDSDIRGMNAPILVDTHAVSVIAGRLLAYTMELENQIANRDATIGVLTAQRNDLIATKHKGKKALAAAIQNAQYELLVRVSTERGEHVVS